MKIHPVKTNWIGCFLVCALLFTKAQGQSITRMKAAALLNLINTSEQPLVVSFWASWCTPCIHEIPWFESSMKSFEKQQVKLVLVSLDFASDYPKNLQDFVKKQGYTSSIVWLDENDPGKFCPQIDKQWRGGIPATLFINNRSHYRKFFSRQLTQQQIPVELQHLTE